MVKSMTGYGKATAEYNDKKITVELRSVNSKQLDTAIRIPALYREKEAELRAELLKLQRGKIELFITVDSQKSISQAQINESLFTDYYLQIKSIGQRLGIETESPEIIRTIIHLPEVLSSDKKEISDEETAALMSCLREGIKQFERFREQEGKVLIADILQRIVNIEALLEKVEPYEKNRIGTIKNRINTNLEEIISSASIDKNRFEQELIYYLEKIDITEEKVRLKQHCTYFRDTAAKEESPGRKLTFISQEIGREINTLSSKANEVNIQQLVVQMKDELEKVKEQLLNVL
ncbi:MAG: YicC family protein [Prevotellaceae bacterium]|jgi:uncharacterized protein (TIGR00255 family)|nr:YicC family protein [Prevotellaceae bacterium]